MLTKADQKSNTMQYKYTKPVLKYTYCKINLQIKRTPFYLIIFQNVIYSCDRKAEFSLLQSSVSHHDPSEIILIHWFGVQDTVLLWS